VASDQRAVTQLPPLCRAARPGLELYFAPGERRGTAATNQALDKLGLRGVDHALGVGVVVPLILADLPEQRVDANDGVAAYFLRVRSMVSRLASRYLSAELLPYGSHSWGRPTPHQSRV
jgi:hypothetical protein